MSERETPPTAVDSKSVLPSLIKRARTDFLTYVLLMNPPSTGFIMSKFHRYLIRIVQEAYDGVRNRRQAVSCPPQHGKSSMLSVEAAAWIMGVDPGANVAIAGYSQDLTISFARRVRTRVQIPLHLSVFPNAATKSGENRVDSFACDNGSSLLAKSVGAKLTGRKVSYLIVDDPHPGRAEAESATQRKRVLEWYLGDCFTRLSPDAIVFAIQTRFHPEDLIGSLTSDEYVEELKVMGQPQEIFDVTNLPAVAEEKAIGDPPDPLGRKPGEALFPELRGRPFLDAVKAALPAYEWESQYMGKPTGHSGGQFNNANLRYCKLEDVPNNIERVRAWDLALTTKQTSDYTVGGLCAYDPEKDEFYVIDIFRNKGTWVKNKKIVIRMANEESTEGVQRIGIEAVAGFAAAYQDIHAELLGDVKVEPRYAPRGDKLTRALPWLNKIEARRFILVYGTWTKEFVNELTLFPDGSFDDQVDCVSLCWEMLTWRWRAIALMKHLKRPSSANRPSSKNRPSGGSRYMELEEDSKEENAGGAI